MREDCKKRCCSEETIPVVSSRLSTANLFVDLNRQWPMLKFMGFGFYYAWIWLMYSSSLVDERGGSSIVFDSYIASTTALALVLALSALFHRRIEPVLLNKPFMIIASLIAMAGTLAIGFVRPADAGAICAFNVLTAIGTGALVLRLGMLYSTIDARESLMAAGMSFVVSAALFFTCIGLGRTIGIVLTALLPLMGCIITFLDCENGSAPAFHPQKLFRDAGDLRSLFLRLIAGIFLISFAIGAARGYVVLAASPIGDFVPGSLMAAGTAVVSIALVLVVGASSRVINLAKVYSPLMVTVVACFTVLSLISSGASLLVDLLGVGYAFVGLIVWCLFSAVSNKCSLSPVFVFGWGRCAWGAAATMGWLVGKILFSQSFEGNAVVMASMICLAFLVVVTVMLVLNERHLEGMLTFDPCIGQTNEASSETAGELGANDACSLRKKKASLPEKRKCSFFSQKAELSNILLRNAVFL